MWVGRSKAVGVLEGFIKKPPGYGHALRDAEEDDLPEGKVTCSNVGYERGWNRRGTFTSAVRGREPSKHTPSMRAAG